MVPTRLAHSPDNSPKEQYNRLDQAPRQFGNEFENPILSNH
jgi:hypothetical protein